MLLFCYFEGFNLIFAYHYYIFCTDPLYRQLDEKITRTVDKVEELKQELKSQRKKEG